jgi:hypothetical protein
MYFGRFAAARQENGAQLTHFLTWIKGTGLPCEGMNSTQATQRRASTAVVAGVYANLEGCAADLRAIIEKLRRKFT